MSEYEGVEVRLSHIIHLYDRWLQPLAAKPWLQPLTTTPGWIILSATLLLQLLGHNPSH